MRRPNLDRPSLLYRFGIWLVTTLMRLFGRVSLRGLEHVPSSGPLLVVSNHLSSIDPHVVAAVIRLHIVFMAKEELFRWPLHYISNWYGAIPVRRGEADREAIRMALELLAEGKAIGVFPEGTRSRSGRLGPGHAGAGLLALRSGAPILPVGIAGTNQVSGPLSVLKRPQIAISVGPPFRLAPHVGTGRSAAASAATETIMHQIARLLPPEHLPEPSEEELGAAPAAVTEG